MQGTHPRPVEMPPSSLDHAHDANIEAMNLATPGKDASNPDKPPPKKALFSSPPAHTYTTDKNLTPSTTEKRNTRESNWVLLRGASIDTKPEQRVKDTIEVIENEPLLEGSMFTKPLEVTSTALVKITTESLDGSALHMHQNLVFLKEGLPNMQAMLVLPKTACVGALASQLAGCYGIYQRIQHMTQKENWCDARLAWMKKVDKLFDTGDNGEFAMSFERSVDRHKDKIKYCSDAMALGFASWALPQVIDALVSALKLEEGMVADPDWDAADVDNPDNAEKLEAMRKHFYEFQTELKSALYALGIQGRERDDGWVVYPVDKTVEITAKGLEVLRLPPGDKVEVKKLISTEELLSGVDVYIAPQAGIFNIKRAFREGGDGLEAVITELGDDVSQVIPRIEMDTEATGLIKLTLRIKLTAEKAVEKKLQTLCKDPRNELSEIKGVPTKLASGDEVRMIWSGDLGTARVRNGLNRIAAITAEQGIKNSEEVKKLKGELEKQIKVNVDAILEQDAKITAYSAHMQGLMDKQASVMTEMQSQHASAMEDLHKQMAASEVAHTTHTADLHKQMADTDAQHAAAMDDLRKVVQQQQQQMGDMQQVVQQQQQMQLSFTTQFGDLFNFMNAVTAEMIEQRNAVKASVLAIKELKDGQAGYVDAIARRQCAVLRQVFAMHTRVTALTSLVPAGPTEKRLVGDGVTSRDFQAGEGDGTKADEQANGVGKHGASRGGDVRAREGDAAVGAAACARLASDTRGADEPNGSAEPGGRVPHKSIHCAVRESGCTRDRRSGESPPWTNRRGGASGMLDGLCGISALGVSYVESVSMSISIPMSASRISSLPVRNVRERRVGHGKFGVFASTRGFHAILVLLLSCAARCEAFSGVASCCTTMELRRADGATLLCRDTTELRCYDRTALQRFGITGRGASCGDGGSAFWKCFDTIGGNPTPMASGAAAEREAEPEPSPRWAPDGQNESRERSTVRQSSTDTPMPITNTAGGVELIFTQQSARVRGASWRVTRCNSAVADPNGLRRRRLRWHVSRRAWKRLMRSLRGNTVAEMFNVALWNAREFHADACPAHEASRAKALWIMRRLQEENVDVCFLLEVMGSQEAFTAKTYGLRAMAKKVGYVVRWMVGEGGSQREQRQSGVSFTNGIAVLVKQATCTIERHVRLEERVLGVWIKGRGTKERIQTRIAAVHGLHYDGTSNFEKQLQATYAWAADPTQTVKGCLVVGDFNYVADEAWRSSHATLSANDRAFRDYSSQPGAEYVLPVASQPLVVWTRKGGDTAETSSSEGNGSMLDGAVTIGSECGCWRRTVVDFAFSPDGPTTGTAKPLSDHAWVTFSREIPQLELRGEKRPLSALPRGDVQVKDSYRDRVREGDIVEELLSVRGLVHATSSAVRVLRRAAEQAAAEVRRRREERPLETAHRWRRWLQEAYAARHQGLAPHEVHGGLFNYHSRLWLIRERYKGAGDDVCWSKIIRRCRRCWTRATQRLVFRQQREDKRLRELSLNIVEGKGSKDLAQVAMRAWKAIRPQRLSLAFDRFHPKDDVHSAPILAAEDPDAFLDGLASEGDRLVQGFSSTPPIIEAFKAFCKVFCPTYDTLRGLDGGEWELTKELTFPVFLQVLQRVPRGKAVGYGGFSIELLIHADRGIKRAFYECLMADLRGGEFPPSWRKVIYVLLTKPPPNNPALISERREIALMAQDMKLIMHMVRATAYRLITGRLRPEQCGWLPQGTALCRRRAPVGGRNPAGAAPTSIDMDIVRRSGDVLSSHRPRGSHRRRAVGRAPSASY